MPIVAVSGSQGQGKSTVLASLAEYGYNTIPLKTSRSILKEWGTTLNEVNRDLDLKKKFQDECLARHIECCKRYDDKLYFSERSFADIFVYTVFALGAFNEYDEWLNEYYEKCKEAQKNLYERILYLSGMGHVLENDGTRSINPHFGSIVDLSIRHYLADFGVITYDLDEPNHEARISWIMKQWPLK